MPVYVDDARWQWRGRMWCHMAADSLGELHDFARRIGLKREWFQQPPKTRYPHYDLVEARRTRAVQQGAIPCDKYTMLEKTKALAEQLRVDISNADDAKGLFTDVDAPVPGKRGSGGVPVITGNSRRRPIGR